MSASWEARLSSEPPEERSRIPQQISVGGGWTFAYAVLAIVFAGTAAWFLFGRHAPLTSPQVVVSGVGSLWFGMRAAMSMAKKP